MGPPAIEAEALGKSFDDVVAVDSVSFAVEHGRTAALLGANGAGKTTTIAMVIGLLLPSAGRARVLGTDTARERHKVMARVSFSSPYVDLPRRLTVQQTLHFFARLYGVARPRRRVAVLAEELDFADLLRRRIGFLSAGQKTRVGLAKALINAPQVMFLDEPTASLDPDTADWVRSYLEAYQRESGCAVLLASHNMGEVERLCHDVMMMRRGRIVDRGSPEALIARYGRRRLEDVFLDIARERRGGVPEEAAQ